MASRNDPAALFREMVAQWEQMTNSFGNDAMKSEGFLRTAGGAGAASLAIQAAARESMEKALAAAQLPTRREVEALGARIAGIEATLARIELAVGAAPPRDPAKPRPTRGRTPPAPSRTKPDA